jgi:hypothetical protein
MDKNYVGEELKEYGNSWLFSPIAWDVLLDKYLHFEIQTPYGFKKSLIGSFDGGELHKNLNNKINNCNTLFDRIIWEMSNQQIFFVKDKKVVADGIKQFLEANPRYDQTKEGNYPLEQEHIKERWLEIANDVENLSDDYECFIFKNTSVDDGVENWFEKYNEEAGEYESSSLREIDKVVAEFVSIDGGTIEFTSNLDFFNKEAASHE